MADIVETLSRKIVTGPSEWRSILGLTEKRNMKQDLRFGIEQANAQSCQSLTCKIRAIATEEYAEYSDKLLELYPDLRSSLHFQETIAGSTWLIAGITTWDNCRYRNSAFYAIYNYHLRVGHMHLVIYAPDDPDGKIKLEEIDMPVMNRWQELALGND